MFFTNGPLETKFLEYARQLPTEVKMKIFKTHFRTSVIDQVNIILSKDNIPTVKNLCPNTCNFPSQYTKRGQLNKKKAFPCRRHVKDGFFFCQLEAHQSFREYCNLPNHVSEVKQIDSNFQMDIDQNNNNVIGENNDTDNYNANCNDNCNDNCNYQCNDFTCITQCAFDSVISGIQCGNEGTHLDGHFYYCSDHILVNNTFLEECKSNVTFYNYAMELINIDNNIKYGVHDHSIYEQRIKLANKLGLGTNLIELQPVI